MEAIIAQITTIVLPTLLTAIGLILTWGLNELRKWISVKTQNETVNGVFTTLNEITKSSVIKAEQTMKEYAADGKITPAEAMKIKKLVFHEIKSQLPKSTEGILKKVANNVDELIDSKIEETVYKLKG